MTKYDRSVVIQGEVASWSRVNLFDGMTGHELEDVRAFELVLEAAEVTTAKITYLDGRVERAIVVTKRRTTRTLHGFLVTVENIDPKAWRWTIVHPEWGTTTGVEPDEDAASREAARYVKWRRGAEAEVVPRPSSRRAL